MEPASGDGSSLPQETERGGRNGEGASSPHSLERPFHGRADDRKHKEPGKQPGGQRPATSGVASQGDVRGESRKRARFERPRNRGPAATSARGPLTAASRWADRLDPVTANLLFCHGATTMTELPSDARSKPNQVRAQPSRTSSRAVFTKSRSLPACRSTSSPSSTSPRSHLVAVGRDTPQASITLLIRV
mgnify:CR=1 FL=1